MFSQLCPQRSTKVCHRFLCFAYALPAAAVFFKIANFWTAQLRVQTFGHKKIYTLNEISFNALKSNNYHMQSKVFKIAILKLYNYNQDNRR